MCAPEAAAPLTPEGHICANCVATYSDTRYRLRSLPAFLDHLSGQIVLAGARRVMIPTGSEWSFEGGTSKRLSGYINRVTSSFILFLLLSALSNSPVLIRNISKRRRSNYRWSSAPSAVPISAVIGSHCPTIHLICTGTRIKAISVVLDEFPFLEPHSPSILVKLAALKYSLLSFLILFEGCF